MRTPRADLDLRIKSGAAITCDLSTRVAGAGRETHAPGTGARALDLRPMGARRRWRRRLTYLGFALAIAIPWLLLLADQLPE